MIKINIQEKISLEKYIADRNIKKNITEESFPAFIAYSLGIIRTIEKPKLKVIARETGFAVMDISDLINNTYSELKCKLIIKDEIKNMNCKSEIILDSFIVPRENNTKTKTRNVYCSAQKRGLKGIEYLVMIAVVEKKLKVVGIKRLNSKPDLLNESINLISEYLEYNEISKVSADNHFFNEVLIDYLNEKNISFISKPKRNTVWSNENLKDCFKNVLVVGYRYNSKYKVYTKALVLTHKIYGTCKIVRVKPNYRAEESKCFYIVSNNINLSAMSIFKAKKQRWKIETVFRDCSQNLGLRACQCTSDIAIDNHVFMSFFTYNFLSEIREKYGSTIGMIKRKIQNDFSVTTNVSDLFKKESA